MKDPLIITVAAVGAELTRAQQPNLPITPAELAADAAACERAGASIYHLHVRDSSGAPTMDVETFRAAHDAIKNKTELIVQFTTGGAVGDDPSSRMAPLELRPEMATLTTGTVNFGDEVFFNDGPLVRRIYERELELGVVPEFEIFDSGMIGNAVRAVEELEAEHHLHFDFVLGVPGAMPAWDDAIPFLAGHLPAGATWSATGIGRAHLGVATQAIDLGGHVRTGFEDVRYFEPGRLARSNSELIERVADMARAGGREIATPSTARDVLGLS
ncbi:MAG: 3-keto-5-aminohexanoate cleavage protein [Actinomycetota bacterium]|nr:3-keto-5-aminohexanoate cleavage protein [Actinomycetota bacterium]